MNKHKKLLVYVAGPFRASTPWLIEQNVRRAEEASLEVWKMGAVAVTPHLLTRHFQDALPDEVWIDGLMSLMSTCDVMLVLPGWKNSSGTKAEIAEAGRLKKNIFYTLKELADWLRDDEAKFKKWIAEEGRGIEEICPECGCSNGFHHGDCEKI
jgi:hypothetical protein